MSFEWMQKLGANTPLGDGRVLIPYHKGAAPDTLNMGVVERQGPLEVTVPMEGEEGAYHDYRTFEVSSDTSDAKQEEIAKAIWKRPKAAEVVKTAAAGMDGQFNTGDGHWRKLKPHQKGRGQGGSPQMGRTWVRRGSMKSEYKPMKHQASFTAAAVQQLGKRNGGGIIAAHGTGTGKTFSAINAFEKLKEQGKARRALVITPAGLRANFLNKGIQRFTTSKGVILQKPAAVPNDT